MSVSPRGLFIRARRTPLNTGGGLVRLTGCGTMDVLDAHDCDRPCGGANRADRTTRTVAARLRPAAGAEPRVGGRARAAVRVGGVCRGGDVLRRDRTPGPASLYGFQPEAAGDHDPPGSGPGMADNVVRPGRAL